MNRLRLLAACSVILATILVAAKVYTLNGGNWAARSRNPILVAASASFSARAAEFAAETALVAGRRDEAEMLARSSLYTAPFSARALRVLGLSLQSRGQHARAAEAMELAGRLGWRDTPTQIWLIEANLRKGNYGAALERVDALVRREKLREEMKAVLLAASLDPATRPALGDRLSSRPAWRQSFFESAHNLARPQFGPYLTFLRHFTANGGTLSTAEIEPITAALFASGHYRQAREIWRAHSAATSQKAGDAVYDGEFSVASLQPRGHVSPFEWRFPQPAGSTTTLSLPPVRAEGRALHATSPGNAALEIAVQSIVLPSGRYTLFADTIAGPGGGLEGYLWRVDCVPSRRSLQLDERTAPISDGWTRLSYDFTVPVSDCSAQRLSLQLRSNQPRALSLWFDNIAVRKYDSQ